MLLTPRQVATYLATTLALALLLAACSSTGDSSTADPAETRNEIPAAQAILSIDGSVSDGEAARVAEAVRLRIDDLRIVAFVSTIETYEVVVTFGDGLDPEKTAREIMAVDRVSIHPVLAVTAPGIQPSEGASPGTEPSLGGSIDENRWLADRAGLQYHLGPAAVGPHDILGARAEYGGLGAWSTHLVFTDLGGESFRTLTAELTLYQYGDPRRQLAIVLGNQIISAPAIAPDVPVGQGLDPEDALIVMGPSEQDQAEAEALADQVEQAHFLGLLTLRSTSEAG